MKMLWHFTVLSDLKRVTFRSPPSFGGERKVYFVGGRGSNEINLYTFSNSDFIPQIPLRFGPGWAE